MKVPRQERLTKLKDILEKCIKYDRLPSIQELSKYLGVAEPTVYADLELLKAAGLTNIVRLRRKKGCAIEELLKEEALKNG